MVIRQEIDSLVREALILAQRQSVRVVALVFEGVYVDWDEDEAEEQQQ